MDDLYRATVQITATVLACLGKVLSGIETMGSLTLEPRTCIGGQTSIIPYYSSTLGNRTLS